VNMRRLAARTRGCSMGGLYRTTRRVMSTLQAWTGARGCARRPLAMQATRPPDERRARHEATGEWPQPSLSAMLAERVRRTPARVYLIEGRREGGRSYTFGDLAARAERMAGALLGLGVRPGEVVSWQLPNWFEAAALAVAIDSIGAVSNPIIAIYREREMSFVCRQARARVLVVPGVVRGVDHRELALAVRAAAPDLEHVLTVRAEPGAGMRALEALEQPPTAPPAPHGPHDVSMLFYTSGTTADPKGVLHTPSTLGAVIRFQAELLHPSPADRRLLQFPLPHLGGIVLFVMLPVAHGSSTVFMETCDPEAKRFGTDGRPVPGCVARLVDEAGRPLGPNAEGELLVYGPQLCVGYLDPALNAAFTPDGFLRTGDLAVMDDEGYIRITGRRKDIIIRTGENLSAKGIEDDLAAHPKVADVAVIGVPDTQSGERVCACVVLRPGAEALTLAEVRAFMEARGVMRQKIPERLELVAELPRNATGKVRKDELRAQFRG